MKRARSRSEKISLAISISFHVMIVVLLMVSFEKTINISAPPQASDQKPIIDAVMITKKSLQEEIKRIEQKETKKLEEEKHLKEMAQKEKLEKIEKLEKQKREKEEAVLLAIKKKNDELKKEADKKLALEKAEKEKKDKKEKEEALKKKEKEKEELAKKKEAEKAELEKKVLEEKRLAQEKELAQQKEAQETSARPNPRVLQNEISRAALLMRNKIHQNWRQPVGFDYDGLKCKVLVKLLPTGDVVDATVVETSGSVEFDRSSEVAIKKASPLPMPADENIAKEFRQFTFTFYPGAA